MSYRMRPVLHSGETVEGEFRLASDTAMLLIACPCGQRMKVPGDAIGKTASCVKCGKKLRITGDAAPADPQPSPPQQTPRRMTPSGTDIPDVIDILLQEGLANAEAVREALVLQQDLGVGAWEIMGRLGRYTFDDLHALMARQKRVAAIDLAHYEIPSEVLTAIPEELAWRGKLIPVDKLGKLLTIAMVCPLDTERVFEVEQITGLKVKPMLATYDAMERTLNRYLPSRWENDWPSFLDGDLQNEFRSILDKCPMAIRLLSTAQMPLLPETQHLFSLSQNMDESIKRRADALLHDPPALARILGLANTSAFGMAGAVDDPGLACALLGDDTMDGLFLGDDAEDSEFWTREEELLASMTQEVHFAVELARSVSATLEHAQQERATAAGALQLLGRFAMAYLFRASYAPISQHAKSDNRLAVERRAYGMTSREAGFMVARSWMLPKPLFSSISPFSSVDADDDTQYLVDLGRFIDAALHDAPPNGQDGDAAQSLMDFAKRLGLSADDAKRLVDSARNTAYGQSASPR